MNEPSDSPVAAAGAAVVPAQRDGRHDSRHDSRGGGFQGRPSGAAWWVVAAELCGHDDANSGGPCRPCQLVAARVVRALRDRDLLAR